MITSKAIDTIQLPHEEGQWIRVRLPSKAIKDEARQAKTRQAIALMADVDMAAIQSLTTTEAKDEAAAHADPAAAYDWQTLLPACVLAWSYDEPVTREAILDLDEATVDVVLAALLPVATETDRKNGSRPSTKR